jgi:sugar phosphate isomerase/epimerase
MKKGICLGPDSAQLAAEAGFDFVELASDKLMPDKSESEFAATLKNLKSLPLPVEAFNCFIPGHLKVAGPDVDLGKVGAHMDVVLRRAGEVGASIVVFGSGGARNADSGFPVQRAWEQLAEAAGLAGRTAAHYGITVTMEPLCKRACSYFQRVDQGIDLVDRVAHPNLKLLADLYHFSDANEPLDDIVKAGNRLAHIHLATPSLPETAEGAAYDFSGFFDALRRAGYDGRVSVEDNPGLLGKATSQRDAYFAISRFLDAFVK